MSKAESLFYQIASEVPEAKLGKMFGADCIKSPSGKAAAVLWQEAVLFKLAPDKIEEALQLEYSSPATHLYAADRPMKGWVKIAWQHSNQWAYFAREAIAYLTTIKK